MKRYILIFCVLFAANIYAMIPPDDVKEQEVWYEELNQFIRESSELTSYEKRLDDLKLWLYKLARLYPYRDERWNSAYRVVQKHILTTPNYAEYFAEQIRRKQKEVAHLPFRPVAERNKYNDLRHKNLRVILGNLPSPESLRVLGDFLSDKKDWPDEKNWPKGGLSADYYANDGVAMLALKKIGLRNPPENEPTNDSPSCVKTWLEWYEKIKAGQLTFSFHGQPNEYRFKPDGTWETIALENSPQHMDVHSIEKSADTTLKKISETNKSAEINKKSKFQRNTPHQKLFNWKWILVGGFLLFLSLACYKKYYLR